MELVIHESRIDEAAGRGNSDSRMTSFEVIVPFQLQSPITPFTQSKNYLDRDLDSNLDCNLDRDPEVVPVYTGHSLFNTTKRITLLFIVQTLLHRNLDNIRIKVTCI